MPDANDVLRALVVQRYRRSFVLPHYTPAGWFECDLFERTSAGYFVEYEVKLTRSDFFADAQKTRSIRLGFGSLGKIEKHRELESCSEKGPSRFYFVTPEGMLKEGELPSWAGLIEFAHWPGHKPPWTVHFKPGQQTQARRLHNVRLDDKIYEHAKGIFYYRFHKLFCFGKYELEQETSHA